MQKKTARKLLAWGILWGMSLGWLAPAAAYGAQSNTVAIGLPNFKVTINGEMANNDYSKYPLIVYKDITYFPMTYSDCRYLGIESTWKGNQQGLWVDATGVTAAYNPYKASVRNGRSYRASIPTFPIKVNGKAVDNSKESYPLLSFRDITYFPMTWKYGVEQFGWDYSFDQKKGLTIQSKNMKLTQTAISSNRPQEPEYSSFAGKKNTNVVIKDGYVYFDNKTGGILQAPLSNPTKTKLVYQLEKNLYYGGDYNAHSLYVEGGKAMLYYHQGGAVMGSDHRVQLNSDGSVRKIQDSYYETTAIGDRLFMAWQGPAPGPGALRMAKELPEESVPLGSGDYWYYTLTPTGGPAFAMFEDQLLVRAAKVFGTTEEGQWKMEATQVYKVDIHTNEVTPVSHSPENVDTAQLEGDQLYYLSKDRIYQISMKDGKEALLGTAEGLPEESYQLLFKVLGGKAYFTKGDGQLYTLGKEASLNPKGQLLSMNITGDKGQYLACSFKETANLPYGILVLDRNGEVVFKSSDYGTGMEIEGDTLYFYNVTTEKVCSGKLK